MVFDASLCTRRASLRRNRTLLSYPDSHHLGLLPVTSRRSSWPESSPKSARAPRIELSASMCPPMTCGVLSLLCEGRSRAMAEMRLFDSEAETGSIKVSFEASSIVPISSSEQLVVQSLFHPLGARVL